MKISKNKQELELTFQTIDHVSEDVQVFLKNLGVEKKNIIRLRLSIEDILLKWQNVFGENSVFTFTMAKRFGKPYIKIEIPGESNNPLESDNDDFGEFASRAMINMGLYPEYQYKNGINAIILKLKKKHLNPLAGLFTAVIGAIVFGIIGLIIPSQIRNNINDILLTPIYNTFMGILSSIAGPMIFLSVAWGIYGIGDSETLGRIGKKMLLRFLGMTVLISAISFLAMFPFFNLSFTESEITISELKSIINLFLGVFPSNVIRPFLEGNTMQIILIATIVGSIMLILGSQTKVVAELIEQVNYVIQYLMELIGSMVSWFIFIVLLQLIWSDSFKIMLSSWRPMLIFLIVTIIIISYIIVYICIKEKVKISTFCKKIFPTFLIAITTASSSAAFGTNISCCEKNLGINKKMTRFGIPLGIVLYKPATVINFMVCALYFSEMYDIEISFSWILMSILIVAIVTIAMPPIPGGALACYTIIFSQLGIPNESLAIVLLLDVLFDFLATGFSMPFIQCELLLIADKLDLLNRDILKEKTTQ